MFSKPQGPSGFGAAGPASMRLSNNNSYMSLTARNQPTGWGKPMPVVNRPMPRISVAPARMLATHEDMPDWTMKRQEKNKESIKNKENAQALQEAKIIADQKMETKKAEEVKASEVIQTHEDKKGSIKLEFKSKLLK